MFPKTLLNGLYEAKNCKISVLLKYDATSLNIWFLKFSGNGVASSPNIELPKFNPGRLVPHFAST
jgi:hypothetical protein